MISKQGQEGGEETTAEQIAHPTIQHTLLTSYFLFVRRMLEADTSRQPHTKKNFQCSVCIADSFKNNLIHCFIGNESNEL